MTDCKPHVLHIFLPATKTIFTVTRGFKVIKIIVTNWASEVGNVGSGPLTERVLAFPPVENHKNGHINIFSTDFLKFFKAGFYYLNILLIKLLKKKPPKLTDLVLRLKLKLFFLIYKQTNHAHLHPQRPFFTKFVLEFKRILSSHFRGSSLKTCLRYRVHKNRTDGQTETWKHDTSSQATATSCSSFWGLKTL